MTEDDQEKGEELSFAELFEASYPKKPPARFAPGEMVSGTVVKISQDTIFVDLGGKSEGVAEADEFRDENGRLTVKEGDRVELRVASVKGEIRLSRKMRVQGAEALEMLRQARESRVPVEGRVSAVKKGGFEVEISGLRAFCPLSQIDLEYCQHPEEHVGGRYPFRVMEVKGRNVVLSRRAILQEEQERKAQEMLRSLEPGQEFEGRVKKVTSFGAFVDIGGIEGLVHVSEMSRARVQNPADFVQPGETVRVKVLSVDRDAKGRPRIALSMKALTPDIWEQGLPLREGDIIRGKVSRLTDFGAFVEVAPGVDGLVHISEIGFERIAHPSRVLNVGQEVEALVLKIDPAQRRISLSLRGAAMRRSLESGEPGEVRLEPGQVLRGVVEESKPYGIFVRLPQIGPGARGLLPVEELGEAAGRSDLKKSFPPGQELEVEIAAVDERGRIRLSRKKGEQEGYSDFLRDQKPGKLGTLGELFRKKE